MTTEKANGAMDREMGPESFTTPAPGMIQATGNGDLEEAKRQRRWGELVRSRGHRYRNCRADNFETYDDRQHDVVASLLRFGQQLGANIGRGQNLVLFGSCGTGKDHWIAALLKAAVLGHGATAWWMVGADIFATIREEIEHPVAVPTVQRLSGRSILAISDPLPVSGELTDFQFENLQRIIDRRYSNCLGTWVTINCRNKAEATERLSVPIVDRLTHNALAVHFDWPSYRERQQQGG